QTSGPVQPASLVGAAAAQLPRPMHLLGDVGEVEVAGEGACEFGAGGDIHGSQSGRRSVGVRAHQRPYLLDQVEQRLALLAGESLAQQRPEPADVGAERGVRAVLLMVVVDHSRSSYRGPGYGGPRCPGCLMLPTSNIASARGAPGSRHVGRSPATRHRRDRAVGRWPSASLGLGAPRGAPFCLQTSTLKVSPMKLAGLLEAALADPALARARDLALQGQEATRVDVTAPAPLRPFIAAAVAASPDRGGAGRPVLAVTATSREAE